MTESRRGNEKAQMMTIGSQKREKLKESGYRLVSRPGSGRVVLAPVDGGGPSEIWYASDHHAGYTIQIGRWGYEFGMDCRPDRASPSATGRPCLLG